MILPTPRNDGRRQRAVAVAGAVMLMFGMHAGLRGTPVPALGSGQSVIRELDPLFLERYATPPPPDVRETAEPEEGGTDALDARVALDQEVGSAIEGLVQRFEPGRSGAAPPADRANGAREDISGIAATESEPRFTELFGAADEIAATTARRVRPPVATPTSGRGGIAVAARSRPVARDAASETQPADPGIAVEVSSERKGRTAGTTDVTVREYEPERFNRTEVDLLTEWMSTHPAELPVGVKVHLHYVPSFLTALMPFASDGRELELFLMFNQSLRELHIVLVEGDRSVYLIDRGFQEQSRSLREGTVRRLDGEIVAVDSHAGAASSDRAREFYNIFLSWWEVAKRDVGR